MLDAYIHNNATTDAGLMWPGFFEVDITTPGRKWVTEFRKGGAKEKAAQAAKKLGLLSW